MSEKPTYKINLSNGAATVLRHNLNQPGWTKTIASFVIASDLLANVVPEPPDLPERPHPMATPNYKEALATWKEENEKWSVSSIAEFTVTEKQRDLIKDCLKYSVEKNTIPPSKASFQLFSAFGLE